MLTLSTGFFQVVGVRLFNRRLQYCRVRVAWRPQYYALEMSFDEVTIERDPDCPVCRERPRTTDVKAIAASLELTP